MKKAFITAIITVLTLSLLLASCGGQKPESMVLDNEGTNAEANSGIQGIVYSVPEGWKQTSTEPGEYSILIKDGSENSINIFATNQEQLSTFDDEVISKMNIRDYYKKVVAPLMTGQKNENVELNTVRICDTDANYKKEKNDKGYTAATTNWLYDDVVYEVYIATWDYEGIDADGTDDIKTELSDEDLADYEYILASIKPGDGKALQSEEVAVDSVGEISFDTPKGFKGAIADAGFADFEKKDGKAIIEVSMTRKEDLKDMASEDAEAPETLKEYYESILDSRAESTKIAGHDGFINISPEENGKIYYANAAFLTENAMYSISLDSGDDNLWDEDGNLQDDAVALTDDEIAAFKDFLKTIKMK